MGATSSPEPDDGAFAPVLIASLDDRSAIATACRQYERVVRSVLLAMLDRFDRDPAYGLIDMKVDLLTGQDFRDDDPIRGRNAVYGWIQGRALESLAGHAAWVGNGPLRERITSATRRLMERTERLRADAGGRLRFLMTPTGQARTVDDTGHLRPIPSGGPSNYSDLFYAKGLAAAAALLDDRDRLTEARRMFHRVVTDITAGHFASDQEQLDPNNPVRHTPGHVPHGPRMIAIGAATVFLETTGDPTYADLGRTLIEHVLDHYTNDAGDMWELNDPAGQPLILDGVLRNDPGHATEFVGLSLKLLTRAGGPSGTIRRVGATLVSPSVLGNDKEGDTSVAPTNGPPEHGGRTTSALPDALVERLCRVLRRNFDLGFSPTGHGIAKAINLRTREPINPDMPWWNLPETMRAAALAWSLTRDRALADIARRCSNAFMQYYVRPDRWLMANQTLDATGRPAARIPATPDADPGYHTGLSLIDALALLPDRD